jgi:hypothetical protein
MVATSDFSGLVSSACALARAAGNVPMVSRQRRMAVPVDVEQVEADGAGFRTSGANPMAGRLPGIIRHEALGFGLGLLALEMWNRLA